MPRPSWRLLHLTPHLGGGVGRALVSLAQGDALRPSSAPQRTVWCLEPPQKSGAVRQLRALGVDVITDHDDAALARAAAAHDLLQCEVWNHPRLFAAWVQLRDTPVRMVHWCHVSGLHFPRLPAALWRQPFPVVLTSECGRAAPAVRDAQVPVKVISSAAGFEHWPVSQRPVRDAAGSALHLGYVGSLNLSKMHPHYVDWLAAAAPPRTTLQVLGDEIEPGCLARRCAALGRPGLVRALGWCNDVSAAIQGWDALVYLLNPYHYGTAEIALLEAMASGVAPIVLDNACERALVADGDTGWVVRDIAGLTLALAQCRDAPHERRVRAARAAAWVRERFTTARQHHAFTQVYDQALAMPRMRVDWPALIGSAPWQWFHATLPDTGLYPPGGEPRVPRGAAAHAHHEITKGSVHHFAATHAHDAQLQAWSLALRRGTPRQTTPCRQAA